MPACRPGVVNLVYGVPAEISEYLIPHPVIRKISFTGSTAIGKQLAALAGAHMKRVTMELGGHAPAIVFDDADIDTAAKILSANKLRNAGQVCISPTRFLVQEPVYEQFVEQFSARIKTAKVGDGLEPGTTMGPLANPRRITAMENFIGDAVKHGATVRTGGNRIGNKGNFFEPTVLTDVPKDARIMNEEPFGPVAVISPLPQLRRRGGGGEPAAVRPGLLCLYALREDRERDRRGGGGGYDVHQPPRARLAGGSVRRGEGFRLRLRGRS